MTFDNVVLLDNRFFFPRKLSSLQVLSVNVALMLKITWGMSIGTEYLQSQNRQTKNHTTAKTESQQRYLDILDKKKWNRRRAISRFQAARQKKSHSQTASWNRMLYLWGFLVGAWIFDQQFGKIPPGATRSQGPVVPPKSSNFGHLPLLISKSYGHRSN